MMMLLQHLYVDVDDVVMVPTPCVDDVDIGIWSQHHVLIMLIWLKSQHFVLMMMMLSQHFYVDDDDDVPTSLC